MELFQNAKAVRLKSVHNKYLTAEEDEESVTQDRNGSSKSAKWVVEFSEYEGNIIRLKSCYNKYLTASNQPFLLGMTGRKVIQSDPGLGLGRVDSSAEWEPIKDGNNQVKLRTRYGQFLRANGGLPPWRNSVTHDIPHRTSTQDWVVWDVDVVEIVVNTPVVKLDAAAPVPVVGRKESFDSDYKSVSSDHSVKSESFAQQEFDDAIDNSPPKIKSGRIIYYKIGDENGESEEIEGPFITFKGNSVEELTKILQAETGLEDIVLCTKSPVNGRLYPLRLQLPPNNAAMHVVVVPSSPKVARILTMSLRALYDTLRIVCCMLMHQMLCSLFHFLIIIFICTLHK